MKIMRFSYNGKTSTGALEGDKINIINGDIFGTYSLTGELVSISEVKPLPPCEPSKVVCVGLNYVGHQEEMKEFADAFPKLFLKPVTAIIADGENIVRPDGVDNVEFEAEFAIVIKKTAKNIEKGSANDYILGYTCMNDVTARKIQSIDGQWTRAKAYDTFAPLGPVISTEVDPKNAGIQLIQNGKVMQSASTAMLIWDVEFLVEEISKIMTLLPGDVISTGTPSGCGEMKNGDKIEIAIDGIGTLTNYFSGE